MTGRRSRRELEAALARMETRAPPEDGASFDASQGVSAPWVTYDHAEDVDGPGALFVVYGPDGEPIEEGQL